MIILPLLLFRLPVTIELVQYNPSWAVAGEVVTLCQLVH